MVAGLWVDVRRRARGGSRGRVIGAALKSALDLLVATLS